MPGCPQPGSRSEGGHPSSVGGHSFAARPGHDLAPLTLSDGRNAYEALGPWFTLLAQDATESEIAAWRTAATELKLPLAVVRVEPAGDAPRWESRMILVRPNQFVAWAADMPPEPQAVLAKAVAA